MLKNILYAMLLGVGMAACLSQQDKETAETSQAPETEATLDAPQEATAAPATFVVEQGHVGNIRIGAPIEQMREQIAEGLKLTDTTLMQEGMQSTAYVLRPEGQPKGLLVEQVCDSTCKVWRINVLGTDFKTPKGIGVGSKFSELQKAYNIQNITFEEGNLVALTSDAGISFVLDKSQIPQQKLAQLTTSTVPANTTVKEILVY